MVSTSYPRSVCLPFESNPIMVRIRRELNKLGEREASSTSAAVSISIGLCGIADLYSCISDVLSLPLTQRALSLHQHQQSVAELLQGSSKLLEIFSSTKAIMLQMKESSRNLQSALMGSQQSGKSSISSFISMRKMVMKSAKQILLSLKCTEAEILVSSRLLRDDEGRISAVIQALRCISIISISIQESLLLFLGSKPKPSCKRGLLFKLVSKRKSASDAVKMGRNELENVDAAISSSLSDGETVVYDKMGLIRRRLEALEVGIEGIQSGIYSVSEQLTQTRVSLLKILSPLERKGKISFFLDFDF